MADTKTSNEAAAATLTGTELVRCVQSGADKKTTAQGISNLGRDFLVTARIHARKTAGAGATEEATLSEVLDFIGSAAQGDVLYRGASAWARLGAGTAGYVLTTGGAAANPAWAATVAPTMAINSQSSAYTLVLGDANSAIYHPAADTTARTWTIPANSSVAFPVGTIITFDNDFGAGALTIAITTDTLVLVGAAGSTGSRTLATGGQATAVKVTSTRWRINGTLLT